MKYCEKCGRKVDTDADTCPYCGAPLREMGGRQGGRTEG